MLVLLSNMNTIVRSNSPNKNTNSYFKLSTVIYSNVGLAVCIENYHFVITLFFRPLYDFIYFTYSSILYISNTVSY